MVRTNGDVDRALLEENLALRQRVSELERSLQRFQHGGDDANTALGRGVGERLALMQEAERIAHIGSWVWDVATDEVMWSEELFRILGYDPAVHSASTEAFYAAVHPDDVERVAATAERGIRTGVNERVEYRIRRPDGTVREVVTDGAYLFDLTGQLRRAVGVVVDRSELIALEEALRQSQKMEALGQLAAGVAHDFNNLLTIIMGNLELSPTPDEPHLRAALDAAVTATRLTEQMLAFARRALLQQTNVDANVAIEATRTIIERAIGEHIQTRFALSPGTRPVRADLAQVQQVLLNLAVNARDAMPQGGELRIATRNVTVGATQAARGEVQPGRYVCIEVRDTGVGMDADTVRRAFEPFFTTKQPGNGTGLGLSMVFGAMRQNGGFVELESQLDAGTRFLLYLPQADAPAETAPKAPGTQLVFAGRRVLLVEDDHAVAGVIEAQLSQAGCNVVCHHDATTALSDFATPASNAADVDLVVSDLRMPHMRGTELVAKLRDLRPELPALFVTGYAQEASEIEIVPGQTGLLLKPFRRDQLLSAIRDVVDPG